MIIKKENKVKGTSTTIDINVVEIEWAGLTMSFGSLSDDVEDVAKSILKLVKKNLKG